AAHCHRHLGRTHLSPTPQTGRTGPVDPDRIRGHHKHDRRTGGVTRTVTYPCSSPQGTLETTPQTPATTQTQTHHTPTPQPLEGPALGQHLTDPLAPYLPPARPPGQPDGTDPAALVDWFTDRTRHVSRPP